MSFWEALTFWCEVIGFGALLRFGFLLADFSLREMKWLLSRFCRKAQGLSCFGVLAFLFQKSDEQVDPSDYSYNNSPCHLILSQEAPSLELYNSIQRLIEVTSFSPDTILLIFAHVFLLLVVCECTVLGVVVSVVFHFMDWFLQRIWKKNKPHQGLSLLLSLAISLAKIFKSSFAVMKRQIGSAIIPKGNVMQAMTIPIIQENKM